MGMVKLVGILNITPDSFSDSGNYFEPQAAVKHALKLLEDGAAFIDVGAESTNPKSTSIDANQEWQRLAPVITAFPSLFAEFSLDTYHSAVVTQALQITNRIIVNDVTSFSDSAMKLVVSKHGLRCILSHLPAKALGNIEYAHRMKPINSEQQVIDELQIRKSELLASGIEASNIIIDPGIGFGKTAGLNYKLLSFSKNFPEHEVMIGYSRKRFLGQDRMELKTNLAAGRIAIFYGAAYLRVHDVAGHKVLLSESVNDYKIKNLLNALPAVAAY